MYDIEAYYEANTVEEANALLSEHPGARIICGGSDVLIKIREGKLAGTETQLLEKDSKKQMCRYIESDANQRILEQLRNDIGMII